MTVGTQSAVLGVLTWDKAKDVRNQRLAATAVALGIAGLLLRWALVNRYGWIGILG